MVTNVVMVKAIHNRLAHITHMNCFIRDFSGGLLTFCHNFITFILRKSPNLSEIRCSSMVRPWLHNPMVQGSNPIDAQKFFSFDHFKLKGCVIQLMVIAKLPWETSARGSNFKIRSTNKDLQRANLSIYSLEPNIKIDQKHISKFWI